MKNYLFIVWILVIILSFMVANYIFEVCEPFSNPCLTDNIYYNNNKTSCDTQLQNALQSGNEGRPCITSSGNYGYEITLGDKTECLQYYDINQIVSKYNSHEIATGEEDNVIKPENQTYCASSTDKSIFETMCKNINPNYGVYELISSDCPSGQQSAICKPMKKTACASTNDSTDFSALCKSTFGTTYNLINTNNSTCEENQTSGVCDNVNTTQCFPDDNTQDFELECRSLNRDYGVCSYDSTTCPTGQKMAICGDKCFNGIDTKITSLTPCLPKKSDFDTWCQFFANEKDMPSGTIQSQVNHKTLLVGKNGGCYKNGIPDNGMARAICSSNYMAGIKKLNAPIFTDCKSLSSNVFTQDCRNLTQDINAFPSEIMGYDCKPGYGRAKCISTLESEMDKNHLTIQEKENAKFFKDTKNT